MSFKLSINTGFAVNRYSEPEEWVKIIGEDLGLRHTQMTADLLNPSYNDKIISNHITRIKNACSQYNVSVSSTFTGGFTRVNHLAHPDKKIQSFWIDWFKRFIDISVELGSNNVGSHFGILTAKDNNDTQRREERVKENIENWHTIGRYAKEKGLSYLSWEPMSISREQGETIEKCKDLHAQVNNNASIPFKMCLDVDHGDVTSPNQNDTNPYEWLRVFAKESPLIHLKQSSANKSGHWPFIKQYNEIGKIKPEEVLETLTNAGSTDAQLILELSFKEREPIDSTVISVLKESVNFWRLFVKE